MTAPTAAPVRANVFYHFDDFELDVAAFELRSRGSAIPMEPQVFEVLSLLVENHERVVTKEEILDAVWPQRYVTEAALNSRIMSARKALGDDGRTQSYIKTVHGRGYRFVETVVQRPAAARAFAVDVEEPVGAPSPRSLPATRQGALPIPATPFVGREHELARLRDLLGRPDARLVSIVGPGGIGKTRLAIEAVASAARPECPLTYVSLQAASDARAAAFAMAAALGVPLVDADHCEQIIEALRGQRRLLVLDNLEHLVDAVGPYISRVLEAAPEIRIVLTSRSVLALAEEWTFRIDGLDHDGPDAAAARLFRQRASQVRAEETDVSFDAAAVTQLGVLLGGMPLAIELAASLSRYHSVTDLVELVSRQSSALATDIRNVPERHRSLSALFGEAFSTLSTDQQGAMEALSVFDTNFSAEAASAVARADLRTLWSLVDRSLVHASDGRFHLHPLLRQYSAERCAGCDERGQTAHAEYFAAFLAQRDDQLKSGGQIEAMSQIDADYDNVVRAWRWAAAHGRVDLIAAGAYSLFCHLTFRARFFEADELAAVAVAAVERAGEEHRSLLGGLLMHHFWVLTRLGRVQQALATLASVQALPGYGSQPRPGIGMDPLTAVSVVQLGAGNYGHAAAAALLALEAARQRGDQSAIAFAAWLAGCGRFRQARLEYAEVEPGCMGYQPSTAEGPDGALADAAGLSRLAAEILESSGEKWLRGYVEIERGLIAEAMGDSTGAAQHFRTACELRRALGDPQGTASALIYLADVLLDDQHIEETTAIHAEASALFERVGDASGVAEAERLAGRIALVRGDFEAARAHFTRTIEQSMAIGFTNNALSALRGLGKVLEKTGRLQPAATVHAFVASQPAGTPFSRAAAEFELAEAGRIFGDEAVAMARDEASSMDIASASAFAIAAMDGRPAATTYMVKRPRPTLVP